MLSLYMGWMSSLHPDAQTWVGCQVFTWVGCQVFTFDKAWEALVIGAQLRVADHAEQLEASPDVACGTKCRQRNPCLPASLSSHLLAVAVISREHGRGQRTDDTVELVVTQVDLV